MNKIDHFFSFFFLKIDFFFLKWHIECMQKNNKCKLVCMSQKVKKIMKTIEIKFVFFSSLKTDLHEF